ncbi:uncharacterized protein LOC126816172 isoform X2 [Patella vulgata]|uniref:uncharacterized protein LOC126816172 isoform X2 n=1 Tax=Patella vulgata TaxID=6465 RepID=UPI0021802898|nr:uncharacterized protein LOC126816172 isoform X2 [Patella vulgata]
MCSNLVLRCRRYLLSFEMMFVCLVVIISAIQASVIDVPSTAGSLRGRTVYMLFTDARTWKEAREVCRQNGGYLINIETEEKYQLYMSMKNGAFSSDIGAPWTGLYWTSPTSRHWDGPGCPPPRTNLAESYHWRSTNDFLYDTNSFCYREHDDGFDLRACDEQNTFICEHYRNDTCSFSESTMTAFSFSDQDSVSTPTLNECKTSCDNTSGCFLTGNLNQVCLMLLATDASNSTIAIKNCSYDTSIDSMVYTDVADDGSDPTDCANEPLISVSSTIICPTVTSTTTETSTITNTSTETITSSITITATEMFNYTVTEYSTNWSTTTEFLTDVSTFTETATETMTTTLPLVSIVTQTIGNIITTVLQISTVTIGGSSLVVSTVTETQTQSCDTVTVDVTGSCSSTVLYSSSPCPSEMVQTIDTTIQSSFSSLGVNASGSTGIKGAIGSDGIMRTLVCRNVIVVTPDPVAEQAAVESIVNELTVDKKNLSAVIQKKDN